MLMLRITVFSIFLLLTACNFVYRPNLQQGNILNEAAIEQLKLGMDPEQVRYLMGTPVLKATLPKDRMEYVYWYQTKQTLTRSRLSLVFIQNKLHKLERH